MLRGLSARTCRQAVRALGLGGATTLGGARGSSFSASPPLCGSPPQPLTGEEKVPSLATIVDIEDETPVAKRLRLRPEPGFSFVAGQWVDVFIDSPSVREAVGGFTVCSTPRQLSDEGWFELVVKRAAWPPAAWVHSEAVPGVQVQVRAGGAFVLSEADKARPLLGVAGGIGITPIHSMIAAAMEGWEEGGGGGARALLLFSANANEGHALAGSLADMQNRSQGRFRTVLHATSSSGTGAAKGAGEETVGRRSLESREGRIGAAGLQDALKCLSGDGHGLRPLALVCGPPGFSEAMVSHLEGLGLVEGTDILLERWW